MSFETPMLTTLKQKLAEMSQDEFTALWNEITERNKEVEGPTAKELIASFRPRQEQFLLEACEAGTIGEPVALEVLLGFQHRESFLDKLQYAPGILDAVQGAIVEQAKGQALTLPGPLSVQQGFTFVCIVGITQHGQYRVAGIDGTPSDQVMDHYEFQPKTLVEFYRAAFVEGALETNF